MLLASGGTVYAAPRPMYVVRCVNTRGPLVQAYVQQCLRIYIAPYDILEYFSPPRITQLRPKSARRNKQPVGFSLVGTLMPMDRRYRGCSILEPFP